MRAVLFAGPSLPAADISEAWIELRPPAAVGDVYRAARQGADLIGIIDARFEDGQTILHKEILYALSRRIPVWGAASMGALRAVECAPFGMRGIGEIFAMYRDGIIDGDHEVAVSHGPAELGYPVMSEPLVNIRATLAEAEKAGALSRVESEQVISVAQRIFYKRLTWETLVDALPDPAIRDRLRGFLPDGRVDLKARDARELLAAVRTAGSDDLAVSAPEFAVEKTHHWQAFVEHFDGGGRELSDEDAAVLDELRLDPMRYAEAVLRAYARRAALNGGTEEADLSLVDALRGELGLTTATSFRSWLEANRTDRDALARFLNRDASLDETLDREAKTLEADVIDDLRVEDDYVRLAHRARSKAEALSGRDPASIPAEFLEFDLRDLVNWFCQSRKLSMASDDLDETARSLGLDDRQKLHVLLRREFEYSQATNGQTEPMTRADSQ